MKLLRDDILVNPCDKCRHNPNKKKRIRNLKKTSKEPYNPIDYEELGIPTDEDGDPIGWDSD